MSTLACIEASSRASVASFRASAALTFQFHAADSVESDLELSAILVPKDEISSEPEVTETCSSVGTNNTACEYALRNLIRVSGSSLVVSILPNALITGVRSGVKSLRAAHCIVAFASASVSLIVRASRAASSAFFLPSMRRPIAI